MTADTTKTSSVDRDKHRIRRRKYQSRNGDYHHDRGTDHSRHHGFGGDKRSPSSRLSSDDSDSSTTSEKGDVKGPPSKSRNGSPSPLSDNSASSTTASDKGDVRMQDVEALDLVDPNEKSLKEDPNVVEETMRENVFSLIYISPLWTAAFWYSLFVAVFQTLLPFLAVLDLMALNDDEGNVLQMPNNVSIQVRVLAGMVLILAVVKFWDLMEAVEKLQKGPPPARSDTPEGARCWKFYLSYSIQMTMGSLFQVTVFVFIMQSTTILDIFLNFAALEFITSVDEFAFLLAKRGWQNSGRFDGEKVEVQFGDGYSTYTYNKAQPGPDDKREDRPVYWDERRGAAFRYCVKGDSGSFTFANSGYWVFNIVLDDVRTIDDMCGNFISRSPETKGFNLLESPGRSWLTKRRLNDTVQYEVDFFQLRCADCQDETCNGKCINDQCVCNDNQYGFNCQFNDFPCPKTDFDRRTKPFTGVADFFSSKYSLMTNKDGSPFYSYNRPVYYFSHNDGVLDLLLNFGRRYFLFDIVAANIKGAVQGFKPHPTEEDGDPIPIFNISVVVDNLTNFHPWYDWIKPIYASGLVNSTDERDNNTTIYRIPVFASDPIDVGTQSDSLSPLGLGWKRINKQVISKRNYFDLFSRGSSAETVLVCSRCSESSPCLNGGTCRPNNNTCECPTPDQFDDDELEGDVVYSGTLCELDCTEEGSDNNPACKANFNPWADDDEFQDGDDGFDGDSAGDDGTSDT